MKWFKHDSDASIDAKMEKLRMRYGMEGYGLYWYCLELIVGSIEEHNVTFQLEHDAEIIAYRCNMHVDQVQEMMKYMVDLGLFENTSGNITCLKLLKRLDSSMTSNPRLRGIIKKHHDGVMTQSGLSHDSVMLDRREEIDIPTSRKTSLPKDFSISDRVAKWAEEKGHTFLEQHLENFIDQAKAKGYQYKDWDSAFMTAIRKDWAGLTKNKEIMRRVK